MSGFSAEWLELREPYDLRARNAAVLDAVFNLLAGRPSVAIVDLACGTGSTFRALSPRISARQTWRLVDHDVNLLARVPPSSSPSINVTTVSIDLNRDLEAAFDSAADLITTSALLDLVSNDWLNRLALEAAARRWPVYAALSYDGRAELKPADPTDRRIVDAVNRHQRTDKGFGPALGPSAAQTAIEAFERVGYTVLHGLSDWEFGPTDREIQTEVLSGWAAAAREIGDLPQRRDRRLARATARSDRRRTFVASRRSRRSACVPHRNALSRGRPRVAACDQAPHLGHNPLADSIAGISRADRDTEGDPHGDVAQRGHEHLKVGGKPPAVLLSTTQRGERVAQSDGGKHAADRNGNDGEVRGQPCEQVHARRPALERLDRARQHCRIRLHASSRKVQKRTTTLEMSARRFQDREPVRGRLR